jgi:toxin-antitoxin system PIN domain toxin
MESPDVNVLVAAFRGDSRHHPVARPWLDQALASGRLVGISELVLSASMRITTNPRAFQPASTLAEAMQFTSALMAHPSVTRLRPGEAHWKIFASLCEASHATGNTVADAYHAALAIEHGAEWITLDRDFAAFPWLKSRNLLAPPGVREARARYGIPPARRRTGKR